MKFRIFCLLLIVLIMSGMRTEPESHRLLVRSRAASMGPYTKIFVMVLSQNTDANYNIETQMANTLISKGFKVVKSTDIFPPNFSLTQDFTREQLAEA